MPWKHKKKLNDFMTAVADDTEGEIWIYGDIVDDAWWDDEVSPVIVRDALNNMGSVSTLNIRINSYGGSVCAGNAIINILDNYRAKTGCKIHAYIEGIAASMSSGVPMVADKIYMAENAMLMIHKPWSLAVGNSDEIEKTVVSLQKAEDTLVVNYMRKFNGTEDELRQLLADETWLTAKEALEWGLCDVIVPAVPVAASAKGIRINNSEFIHDAGKIAARFTPNTPLASSHITHRNIKNGGDKNMQIQNADPVQDSTTNPVLVTLVSNTPDSPVITDRAVITESMVKDTFGDTEITAQEILDRAKNYKEPDPVLADKAKAYDKMVKNAIDEAIKMGIKAKGDGFKEDKWRKILNGLDYDDIIDQKSEWEEEAKIVLNAGKRVSQPWEQGTASSTSVNPDNYNFC